MLVFLPSLHPGVGPPPRPPRAECIAAAADLWHTPRMDDHDIDIDFDLDLEAMTRPGRQPVDLCPQVVRPLRPADLALLAVTRQTEAKPLKKLTERHHGLARLIASGVAHGEAGVAMGYEPARVSVLVGDPAFSELVSFYREKVDLQFADTMDQISGLSKDAILELRERIEDEPEKFSIRDLKDLMQVTLDRSGFGPTHKQETTINVNLASKLEHARKRALEARRSQIIDVTPDDSDE